MFSCLNGTLGLQHRYTRPQALYLPVVHCVHSFCLFVMVLAFSVNWNKMMSACASVAIHSDIWSDSSKCHIIETMIYHPAHSYYTDNKPTSHYGNQDNQKCSHKNTKFYNIFVCWCHKVQSLTSQLPTKCSYHYSSDRDAQDAQLSIIA